MRRRIHRPATAAIITTRKTNMPLKMSGFFTSFRWAAAFCGTITLAACAPSPGLQTGAPQQSSDASSSVFVAPAEGPAGYKSFEVGGVQVPLPEGSWTLVGSQDLTINDRYPATGYVLVSETNGAIDRVVTLWRQRTFSGRFGDFKNCSAKSNLTSDVVSQAAQKTDCVFVRAVAWPDKGKIGRLLRSYAKSKGLYAPLVTVGPRVALSLASRDRIAIDYGFNTDLIAPPPNAEFWRPSDWTPAAATSPPKKAVVDALRGFGAKLRPAVASANQGSS